MAGWRAANTLASAQPADTLRADFAAGLDILADAHPDAARTVVEHVAQLRDEIARFRRDFERQRRAVPRVAGRRRRPRERPEGTTGHKRGTGG